MLLVAISSLPTFARDFSYSYEGQTLKYTILDEGAKTCSVGKVSDISGNVIIPSVTKDGNIEYAVTEIGERAFEGCRGLTSVTIPNSITEIGDHAFYGCSGLTSVPIPDSSTVIHNGTFAGCSGLTW